MNRWRDHNHNDIYDPTASDRDADCHGNSTNNGYMVNFEEFKSMIAKHSTGNMKEYTV